MRHTANELLQWQALPLDIKIRMTASRIRGWVNEYGESGTYVSFSGGKDSTVLLDIVRNKCGYKNVPAMFVDVPTQYPELRDFAKTFNNVDIVRPSISFAKVCEDYGFPIISKEVADDVEGAKKYLLKLLLDGTIPFDRQIGQSRLEIVANNAEYLAQIMNDRMVNKKGGSNQRLAIMLGWLTKDMSHPIRCDLASNAKSKFDHKKYQFFLDSKFDISGKCCDKMKKDPAHCYSHETKREPMTAEMAAESRMRKQKWFEHGCNAFDAKEPKSTPMAFWTENDVLQYIKENNLQICSVYGDVVCENGNYKTTGCTRTGCMLCGFGCHFEKPEDSRFLQLKKTHPGMYNLLDVIKNNGVTFREAIEWTNEHGNLDIRL